MYNLRILSILFVFFVLGCTSEKQEVETVSIDELMGDTKPIPKLDTTTNDVNLNKVDSMIIIADLIQNLATIYTASELTKSHSFDRYGFNTKAKTSFILKSNQGDTLSSSDLYVYTFSDSIKLNNAFYNLLDCFGDNCSTIKLKEDIEKINTNPSTTIVFDTVLVNINYNSKYNKNDWNALLKNITTKYGSNYRYKIDVTKKGKLNWN